MESGWRYLVNGFWQQPVASLGRAAPHLRRWFETPVGRRMLSQELELIEQCRTEYRTGTMLQISGAGALLMGKTTGKTLKVDISPELGGSSAQPDSYSRVISDLDALPLDEGVADFLVLHHSLEFSPDPHAALREAARVLSPQGHLIIICFNPHSLFGVRKALQVLLRNSLPWAHHRLTRSRVTDWLKLMGCEPQDVAFGFYGYPLQNEKCMGYTDRFDDVLRRRGVPGGGFYMIHARREVDGWVGSTSVRTPPRHLVRFPAAVATRSLREHNQGPEGA